jgi:hypothetical protein
MNGAFRHPPHCPRRAPGLRGVWARVGLQKIEHVYYSAQPHRPRTPTHHTPVDNLCALREPPRHAHDPAPKHPPVMGVCQSRNRRPSSSNQAPRQDRIG